MKKTIFFIVSIMIISILILPNVTAQDNGAEPKINTPEFYFTNVYERVIEGVRIYIECPITDSHMGNQNITFRVATFNMDMGMKLIMIKNEVVLTLEHEMDHDDYYFYGILLDNPRGTNCSLQFILKTTLGDFTVLDIKYIVSLADPAVEKRDETVYWKDKMEEEATEKIKAIEEETYFNEPLSFFYYLIIGAVAVAFFIWVITFKLGKTLGGRVRLKSTKLKDNAWMLLITLLSFLIAFAIAWAFFAEPLHLISEEKTRAEILGYPFESPVPYKELVYSGLLWVFIFLFIIIINVSVRIGWWNAKIKDPVMLQKQTDKVNDPNIHIWVDQELCTLDRIDGVDRKITIDYATRRDQIKRGIFGPRVCPRYMMTPESLGDDLKIKLREMDEEYDLIPLDSVEEVPIDYQIPTTYRALTNRVEEIREKQKKTEDLGKFERLRFWFSKLFAKHEDETMLLMTKATFASYAGQAIFNANAVSASQEAELESNRIASICKKEASQARDQTLAEVAEESIKDEALLLDEELRNISKSQRIREDYTRTIQDELKEMKVPSEEY